MVLFVLFFTTHLANCRLLELDVKKWREQNRGEGRFKREFPAMYMKTSGGKKRTCQNMKVRRYRISRAFLTKKIDVRSVFLGRVKEIVLKLNLHLVSFASE
jgi:hypothetical protein